MKWVQSNWFLIGLISMIGLAWLTPEWGSAGGTLKSEISRRWAVWLIFFIQGFSLPTESLRQGIGQMRVHGFVLGWNYLGAPLIVFMPLVGARPWIASEVFVGFAYLAILPTTITSAVFFTGVARGNVATSVFSSVVSNLASVFLVPAGVALVWWAENGGQVSLSAMFGKLCLLIVFPMALGQVLRPAFWSRLSPHRAWLRRMTTGAIFFIMYCTFSDGVHARAWEPFGWGTLVGVLLGALVLLAMLSILVWWTSGFLKLERSVRIAAFYCGAQKSLATGVPMASSIFSGGAGIDAFPEVSVIVVPLMCFHFMQLVLAAKLADRFRVDDGIDGSRG